MPYQNTQKYLGQERVEEGVKMVTWNKDLLDGEGDDVATKNREALGSQLMSSFEVSVSVQDLCFL